MTIKVYVDKKSEELFENEDDQNTAREIVSEIWRKYQDTQIDINICFQNTSHETNLYVFSSIGFGIANILRYSGDYIDGEFNDTWRVISENAPQRKIDCTPYSNPFRQTEHHRNSLIRTLSNLVQKDENLFELKPYASQVGAAVIFASKTFPENHINIPPRFDWYTSIWRDDNQTWSTITNWMNRLGQREALIPQSRLRSEYLEMLVNQLFNKHEWLEVYKMVSKTPSYACLWLRLEKHENDAEIVSTRFLLEKEFTRIGKGPENEIQVRSPIVSANHAKIHKHEDEIIIEDLKSSNGTYVLSVANGKEWKPVYSAMPLQHGDVICLGPHSSSDSVHMQLDKKNSHSVTPTVIL